MIQERRRHERSDATLQAYIKISTLKKTFKGKAETINVSVGGFNLKLADDFGINPAIAEELIGRPVEIIFDDHRLTAWGDILRTENDATQIAVLINEVSNKDKWNTLCEVKKTA